LLRQKSFRAAIFVMTSLLASGCTITGAERTTIEDRRARPEGNSGWRLLPKTSDPVDITLKLLSPADGRVVQTASRPQLVQRRG